MVAILYEGKSDGQFFNDLLEKYALPKSKVVYYDFQGKDNLFNISHIFYNEIEEDIKSGRIQKILIIADADNPKDPNPHRGYEATKSKLQEIINNLDFSVPIEYYIMCDETQQGYLESFLLSVLDNKQKMCIEDFKNCFKYFKVYL